MGRYLKNTELVAASNAIRVPIGPTSSRPEEAVNGQIRFNTDIDRFEIYNDRWYQLAVTGNAAIVKDQFLGDGTTTDFALSLTPPGELSLLVFVGNVFQNPMDAFIIVGNSIRFVTAPPSGQTIVVLHNFSSTDAH
jgi:hypothetical protein